MSAEPNRVARVVRRPVGFVALILGAALVTWIVTVERMQGVDAGPGTDLGAVGWYVGIWVTMMAAMMLPSVAPMVLLFAKVARGRAERGRVYISPWIFLGGYLAAWTAFGLAAYGIFRGVRAADPGFLAWGEQGPRVAGGPVRGIPHGRRARGLLRRLLLGAHGRAPRARRHEPLLDGGRRQRDLRREG